MADGKPGRPTLYTDALALEICERLRGNGPSEKVEALAVICRDAHMPAVRTVSDWKRDHPDFSADFARAREDGWDALAAECLEIADEAGADIRVLKRADGSEYTEVNLQSVPRAKLRIWTRFELLARWDPSRYGNKLALTGGRPGDEPIRMVREVRRTIIYPTKPQDEGQGGQ